MESSPNLVEITKNVYWVGVKDWNRRLFDAFSLPYGTTYNAYLVKGEGKTALVDTVEPGFQSDLIEKIKKVVDPASLDYLVMNHAEPDHAGTILHLLSLAREARLVTSKKGAKMAERFYGVPEERIIVVDEQSELELGTKTLRFVEAPWLHWPETMFTYLVQDKVLFSCDFLGAHFAPGTYAEDVEDGLMLHAKRYFGEIMMPFRPSIRKALSKIKEFDINIVAPSHGPIYKNPGVIIENYKKWASEELRAKAIIVYVTMWKSTEKMVQAMVETLSSENIEVTVYDLTVADMGEIAKDLVDASAIILGAPTVLAGAHPLAVYAAHLIKALRPPTRFAAVLSSYGWAGSAVKQIQQILETSKIEIVGAVEVNGPPRKEDILDVVDLGRQISKKIKNFTTARG